MTEIDLPGLRTRPLATYLAAIGLFRIVGEQVDRTVRARWRGQYFVLDSALGLNELRSFLLNDYAPSPLVAPWNGSDQGGFRPGADTRASRQVAWLEHRDEIRFAPFRDAAHATRQVVGRATWQSSNDTKDKAAMVLGLRNALPDAALRFLDTAVALTSDSISFPPIFGTGGNIGRLDLVINYLEHLQRIVDPGKGDRPGTWLEEVLLGTPEAGVKSTPGQYDYQGVGGANLGRSGAAPERVNPWTYVLAVEGSLAFEATATRRLGSDRARVAAPFTVASAPAGYASATEGESAKGEMWMPVWGRPWALEELASLLAEGRATWNGRQAYDGTDLLRATRTLGIDRGISTFERFAFLERNGQSPAAVPVGTVQVREDGQVRLTAELDPWISRLNRGGDNRVPAGVRTARNRVNRALYDASSHSDGPSLKRLLLCVASAERTIQRSSQFQELSGIGPVPDLSPAWLAALRTEEPEQRIALLLAMGHDPWTGTEDPGPAARSLREHLRPVTATRTGRINSLRSRGSLVPGLGSRPVADVLADVAVLRARTAPAPRNTEAPAIRGVHLQFPVARTDSQARDPRASAGLAEQLAGGALDLQALSEWLEVLLLLRPVRRVEALVDLDRPAKPWANPVPLWRLFAPWFAQAPLAIWRSDEADGPGQLRPTVRSTWPARLRRATPTQLGGLAREVRASYGAARLSPSLDPSAYATEEAAADTTRVLAALMVPTRIRDLADLAGKHLHLDQGAPP